MTVLHDRISDYRDERSSPECVATAADAEEMSGTESQQGDELEATEEEITVQEVSLIRWVKGHLYRAEVTLNIALFLMSPCYPKSTSPTSSYVLSKC